MGEANVALLRGGGSGSGGSGGGSGTPGPLPGRAVAMAAAVEGLPSARVRIASLAAPDSPCRTGTDLGHARLLAGSDDCLPPILVHKSTMRVIDGMHRLRAAQLRGEEEIEVRLFDGDSASAFVLAVQANVRHGLPLCLADRKAAADRIIGLYPAWSDRAIAEVAGLSASTVGVRRRHLAVQDRQLDAKVGRDGRVRPVDPTERRAAAERLLAASPGISLREVARQAGLSPETVRRLRADIGPASQSAPRAQCPSVHPAPGPKPPAARPPTATVGERPKGSSIRALAADPAFRSTDAGRTLLRMLSATGALDDLGDECADAIPAHCLDWLALAVQERIGQWQAFAAQLERRRQSTRI